MQSLIDDCEMKSANNQRKTEDGLLQHQYTNYTNRILGLASLTEAHQPAWMVAPLVRRLDRPIRWRLRQSELQMSLSFEQCFCTCGL